MNLELQLKKAELLLKDRPEQAVLVLRAAWVLCPCSELAELIYAIHEVLPKKGPVEEGKHAQDAEWLTLASSKNPSLLPTLLAWPWASTHAAAGERIKLLSQFPADPRILRLLEAQVQKRTITQESNLRLVRLFQKTFPEARAFPDDLRPKLDKLWDLARFHRQQINRLEQLLIAIGLAPDALAPRAVLVDFLLEQDEPRGEWLALLLKEPHSRTDQARLKELNSRYLIGWLDAMPGLVNRIYRLKKGLLSFACLRLLPGAAAQIRACCWWNTVEEISLEHEGSDADLEELLAPGAFYGLRQLSSISVDRTLPARFGLKTVKVWFPLRTLHPTIKLDLSVLPDLEVIEGSFQSFPILRRLSVGSKAHTLRSGHAITGGGLSAYELSLLEPSIKHLEFMGPEQRLSRGLEGRFSEVFWDAELSHLIWLLTLLEADSLKTVSWTISPNTSPELLERLKARLSRFPSAKQVEVLQSEKNI